MSKIAITTLFLAVATVLTGQDKQFLSLPVTPESQFLELVDLEADVAKQVELINVFVMQFPKYDGMPAVYGQLQDGYNQLGRWDDSLAIGEKLAAVDESDVETVKRTLEAAQGKKDEALIKKWSDRLALLTHEPEGTVTASSTTSTPYAAEEPVQIASTGKPVITARMRARLEAAMFNRAAIELDAKKRLELIEQFTKEYPESAHANGAAYLRFLALRDSGDEKSALAAAEAILTRDQTREDVLLFTAARYFNQKREHQRVIEYCQRVTDLLTGKPKPETISDVEWTKQKGVALFESAYMTGSAQVALGNWALAEKAFRGTLKCMKPGDANVAAIQNSLAWVNYKLKNIPEAMSLYEQCSKTASWGAACKQSLDSIKSEYGLQ